MTVEEDAEPRQPRSEPANPVHMVPGPDSFWTTVNLAEAVPGVQLPLSWSFWGSGCEAGGRGAFGAMGVMRRSEIPIPPHPDNRIIGIFYGRAAGNVNQFRRVGDCMPGSSGDEVEQNLLGAAALDTRTATPRGSRRRYPVVLARLPGAALGPRVLPGVRAEYADWWRRSVIDSPPVSLPAAQELIRQALHRFNTVFVPHTITTMLGTAMLDALGDLAERATGDRALAADLATGYGSMEETGLIEDLWSASTGVLDADELLRRHGYHGPREGDLATRAWREDRGPLQAILDNYTRSAVPSPREREHTQASRRESAETAILAGLPASRRAQARIVMKAARYYIPKRETGKAAFLHALDAGRCAARAGGLVLADRGLLADPEDVFYLTFDEFLSPSPALRDLIDERRARHDRYLQLRLPATWRGIPEPVAIDQSDGPATDGPVTGLGVVGGTVTGRARVVHDPAEADLEPGDILVCAITDPSWTPLFLLADALVIDTGGAMSHGAIVARELGVTCVINTGTGTRSIPDGAIITVDGSAGTVVIAQERTA